MNYNVLTQAAFGKTLTKPLKSSKDKVMNLDDFQSASKFMFATFFKFELERLENLKNGTISIDEYIEHIRAEYANVDVGVVIEIKHNETSVEINKDIAIQLRDFLNEFIEANNEK